MPLDSTPTPQLLKAKVVAKPKAAAKPDPHAVARAVLDDKLAALLGRAKTAESRDVLALWASTLAASQDEAWRGAAKRALITRGTLPDYAADPLPVGTVATIYSDPLVLLTVKVAAQAARLDVEAAFAALATAGVKPALLRRVRKKYTTNFAGAHIITAVLTE